MENGWTYAGKKKLDEPSVIRNLEVDVHRKKIYLHSLRY